MVHVYIIYFKIDQMDIDVIEWIISDEKWNLQNSDIMNVKYVSNKKER